MSALTTEQSQTVLHLCMKLSALKISGEFKQVEAGPIVSTYYFTLGADIPIAKIMKSEEDLALAVGAPSVLITRLGAQIAIAIPNKTKETVSYDKCLHALMQSSGQGLPIMLGVDTKGTPNTIDLRESPHILAAGSTGSGKSVLLAAIISGLATKLSSREMKLMLVDTKQLDLPLFASLPHTVEVADDIEKIYVLFERLMQIVRQRTEKMKGVARNITEYNRITGAALPYYVVVIDEYADIVGADSSIALKLQKLVQICRAAGIHVILATQRPSVKIITGDIKANFGTRIALKLPTGYDSKTIIDEYGAEQLLGKGDMLCKLSSDEQVTRYHGPMLSMDHISNVLANCDAIRDSYKHLKLN